MIIDAHHHLGGGDEYPGKLVAECDRLKIDKMCLMALPEPYGFSSNTAVEKAFQKYPDRLIGFAHIALGTDKPEKVVEYQSRGFKGLKFIIPPANYDDKSFYPVYKKAEEVGMPVLFHLGIVARDDRFKDYDINSNRMRPIYLDTIARAFPDLQIIGAHLGNPWFDEAAMAARWNPNLYFDITGSTLKKKDPTDIGKLLWWTATTRYRDPLKREAWEKIVFGSDVPFNEIGDVLNDYKKTLGALNIKKEVQDKVFGSTMARILKID